MKHLLQRPPNIFPYQSVYSTVISIFSLITTVILLLIRGISLKTYRRFFFIVILLRFISQLNFIFKIEKSSFCLRFFSVMLDSLSKTLFMLQWFLHLFLCNIRPQYVFFFKFVCCYVPLQ